MQDNDAIHMICNYCKVTTHGNNAARHGNVVGYPANIRRINTTGISLFTWKT